MELDGAQAEAEQISALALTNYGHFTSMRVENRSVRGLSLHLDRLADDCRLLFDTELDRIRVRDLIRRAVSDFSEPIVIRVTIFDPGLDIGTLGARATPRVLITGRPPAPLPTTPLRLQSAPFSRELPEVKHVGLFSTLHHRRAAQRSGFDDVLLVGPDGLVSEVATSNIGIVRGDNIIWPEAPCLSGVTMRLVDGLLNGRTSRKPLTLKDFTRADAVFATNAAVGIRPVGAIDKFTWSSQPHPILLAIQEQYASLAADPL